MTEDSKNDDVEIVQAPATDAAREAKTLETSLDLLANIALLTITALKRVIQNRGPEGWTNEHEVQLNQVRTDIQTATEAVDRWMDEKTGEAGALDLSKLQNKLAGINQTLEQWPVSPPS